MARVRVTDGREHPRARCHDQRLTHLEHQVLQVMPNVAGQVRYSHIVGDIDANLADVKALLKCGNFPKHITRRVLCCNQCTSRGVPPTKRDIERVTSIFAG